MSATDWRVAATDTDPTGHDELDAPVDPERLLRTDETLQAAVGVGDGWLAVTSHRLLVFDPEGDGKHLRAPNRLNVGGVRATAAGDSRLLGLTARAAVYAVLLFGGWLLARQVGLASLLDVRQTGTEAAGLGALQSILSTVDALLGFLVTGLLAAAAVAGLAALGLGARYLQRRERTVRVDLVGGDAVELPVPSDADGERAARRVSEALDDDLTLPEDA